MWGQSDYSSDYTGNITLSTSGGSNASTCNVKINNTDYDGIKAGSSKNAGAVKISVPSGTKYLHLHVAGWNGESVTLAVTSSGYSDNISLTSDAGISGSGTTFTLSGTQLSNYYKVITFSNALTANTDLTFTATSGKRFVVWGVTAEEGGSTPTPTTYTVSYNSNGATSGTVPTDATAYSSGATVTVKGNTGNLAKTDYTFAGWNTADNGSGTNYAAGETFTINANTTLYAKWTANSGGSGNTITLTQSNLGLTGSYTSNTQKNIDGITYVYTDLMKNNTDIQAAASSGTIKNTTPFSGDITSVAITHSGTARATTINGSVDGTNWTQVATGSGSISADFSGRGFRYFQITRGSNAAYWTKIEITTAPAYDITVSSNNNAFGTVALSGNVITATPANGYRVIAGNGGFDLISGTASVTNNGDNTFTVNATSDCAIRINFEEIPTRTVTFSVNGTTSTQVFYEGAAITFPTATDTPAANTNEFSKVINGMTFVGWYTSTYNNASDAPAFVNTANATMGNSNITYYAVFANVTGSIVWQKKAASEISEAGTYALLTTDGHAFNGTITSGHGQVTSNAFSFTNNEATSAPEGTCEIVLEAVTGGYTMYNSNHGYLYASAASSGKLNWHDTENSYWSYASSNWKYNSNSAYLRSYDNSSLRTYNQNNGDVLVFAKKVNNQTYSDYCTTVPDPAITLTSPITAPAAGTSGTVNVDYTAIDFTNDPEIYWYTDATATSPTTKPSWIETAEINSSKNLHYVISANTGAARTAYLKVYAIDVNDDDVYSELITITQAAATVAVTISSAAKYATFSNAKAVDFTGTGITAYTATEGTTSVSLTEITSGKVPANTPVVLYKSDADGTAINVPVTASADDVGTNHLHIVGEGGLTGVDGVYVLAKPSDKPVGFYLWDKTQTLNAGKIYLQSASGARSFLPFDEATAIDNLNVNDNLNLNGEVYDLQGRRVAQPTKGLYIVNGRKVVIK